MTGDEFLESAFGKAMTGGHSPVEVLALQIDAYLDRLVKLSKLAIFAKEFGLQELQDDMINEIGKTSMSMVEARKEYEEKYGEV